jgi:hypothetical protein
MALSTTSIHPEDAVTVSIHGSPNHRLQLMAYSQPSTTYRVARDTSTDANGNVVYRVTPGTNTRIYASYGDGNAATDSDSQVINVHTTLSLSAVRRGVRSYHFQGRNLPRRDAQLITLYRLLPDGREIRTANVRTDSTGTWGLDRTFTGSGTFDFVARTTQNLTNADGVSSRYRVAIH